MTEQHYDVIVIGSGAGGAAVVRKMVNAGKRMLVLEKGDHLPRDGSTLDVKAVFAEGRFKNQRLWVDGHNQQFVPGEFYNVGGKTKWYGAALLRFAPHEFEADEAFACRAWPIAYDQLAPYYAEAEDLLHVRPFEKDKAFYFKDPDGNHLELLQFPEGKGGARWHAPSNDLFLGIDHTAIVVNDTEQALRFYRDGLGLKV